MTRDEAIETLKEMIEWGDPYEVNYDACKIAIEALKQEPCGDAISRQAALKLFATNDGKYLYEAIRDLPSVTPQEPKTGHWEMCEDADGIYGVCDICGTDADFSHYGKAYTYCPNCGAKMESEERA